HNIAAPNDSHVTKMLHLSTGKLKPNQFSPFGVKLGRGSKHIGLSFPFLFSATHDNSLRRH
ncbi:MAG: hypothetical protein WBN74_16005, partial [Candidatus Sulfotelmatobacter sp.]